MGRDQHNWTTAFNFLTERARAWYGAATPHQYADDFYLFLLGITALTFIVAYASTWINVQSRWL